jgi:hypothetical protein
VWLSCDSQPHELPPGLPGSGGFLLSLASFREVSFFIDEKSVIFCKNLYKKFIYLLPKDYICGVKLIR